MRNEKAHYLINTHRGAAAATKRVEAPLKRRLRKALRCVADMRATLMAERVDRLQRKSEFERTYREARDAQASTESMYWLALARSRMVAT